MRMRVDFLRENRQCRIREKVRRRGRFVLEKSTRSRSCKVGRSPPSGADRVSFGVAMQANDTRVHVNAYAHRYSCLREREKVYIFTHTSVSDDFTCIPHMLAAQQC